MDLLFKNLIYFILISFELSDQIKALNLNKPVTTNDTNNNLDLEKLLGPQKKPVFFIICMGTIYILIFICGIVGNISACFVIGLKKRMHTSANYFLFSLALSNLLSLISGLPIELYSILTVAYPWPFGETFCILRTFVFEITTLSSVLTILAFTFERWMHICKPSWTKNLSIGFSRTIRIICFIWLFSSLVALPYSITTNVFYEYLEYPDSKTCGILKKYKNFMKIIIQLSVLFLFFIPMILISIMYSFIGINLWKSNKKYSSDGQNEISLPLNQSKPSENQLQMKSNSANNLTHDKLNSGLNNSSLNEKQNINFENILYNRRDVVKMLWFFICWAPYHTQRFLTVTINDYSTDLTMKLLESLYYISGISIYISSTLNPILYYAMLKQYRTAISMIFFTESI